MGAAFTSALCCASRRRLLVSAAASAIGCMGPAFAATAPLQQRRIPRSGELLPLVGLGTWITFNVGEDPAGRAESTAVMRAFFEAGGRLIDSSPMYGSAQAVVGHGLRQLGHPRQLFAADKVWTASDGARDAQVETSRRHWDVPRFDLLQVHNLLAWEAHLPALLRLREQGRLKHVGITTSEGRRHGEIERLLAQQPIDTVQLTYNLVDREVEQRILPLAAERGIAVIVNRPFQQGELLRRLARHPLPPWAREQGMGSWAQASLKFVISHPAVTCAIPATSQVAHLRENLACAAGPLLDATLRERLAAHVRTL
jgi:diketogulonate reductase-like aldo/keto reductase